MWSGVRERREVRDIKNLRIIRRYTILENIYSINLYEIHTVSFDIDAHFIRKTPLPRPGEPGSRRGARHRHSSRNKRRTRIFLVNPDSVLLVVDVGLKRRRFKTWIQIRLARLDVVVVFSAPEIKIYPVPNVSEKR